jgi:hypothetical protein
MSVSGVGGSNPLFTNWAMLAKTRVAEPTQKSIQQLGQDLKAGNLSQAQADFATITAPSGSAAMSTGDSNSFAQSMGALGQALQGGDLQAAQDAFTQVQQTLAKSGVHRHHHHHGGGGAQKAGAANAPTDPFAQAFGAIGQALQSGDLAGAQSAFSQLDGLLQAASPNLTVPGIGAISQANPAGNIVDLTA